MVEYYQLKITRTWLERLAFWVVIGILIITLIVRSPACTPVECPIINTTQLPVSPSPTPVPEQPAQIVEPPKKETVFYVDMENLHFAPDELVIPLNATIIFTNKEKATAHKVYEIKGLFYGPRMLPGEQWNYTFTTSGTYTAYSVIGKDAGMKVKITVS